MTILLPDVIEQSHGMVLYHHIVRGEGLRCLIHPALNYLVTAPRAEVLREGNTLAKRQEAMYHSH